MSSLNTLIKDADNFVSLKPVNLQSIQTAESQLELTFASEYKEYVLAFGAASFNGKELTGICESARLSVVSVTERARKIYPHFPKNVYVVEDLSFDHIFITQDSYGKVYSYGPSDSGYQIAESLQDYLFAGEQ